MEKKLYKRNLLIPSIKIVCDIAAIGSSVFLAYYMRFNSIIVTWLPPPMGYIPPLKNYVYFSLFVALMYIILFSIFRSYKTRLFSSFLSEVGTIFKVNFIGIFFAMSGAFLYRDFSYSRLVFLLILIHGIILVLIERFLFHKLKKVLLQRGYNILRTYLIGSPEQLTRIIPSLIQSSTHHFEITGYLCDESLDQAEFPYLGKPDKLINELKSGSCEALIIAFNVKEHHLLYEIIKAVEGKNIELFYIPDLLDLYTANYQTLEINNLFLLQLKRFTLSGWQGFLKYIFDILISLTSLVILFPFFIIIPSLIKLNSPGPVFYKHKRVGLDGNQFDIIKFRSMTVNAEDQTGPVWAKPDDTRVTSVGRILRRTSLDELPQLINVIRGEMSLVGPRPERPHFVEQFQEYIPKYLERHRVRSGITGWAQINGLRGQSPVEERTKYDVYYIENWSLWFDIKIIIMTFIAIIRGKNAY